MVSGPYKQLVYFDFHTPVQICFDSSGAGALKKNVYSSTLQVLQDSWVNTSRLWNYPTGPGNYTQSMKSAYLFIK